MPILLINKAKVAEKLQVAIGYSDMEFNAFINEAQEFDFKPLVQEDFYFDLLAKKADAPYVELIDGGNYDYKGRTYNFQGIATVLSYFAFARFKLNSSAVSTSHGFVVKTTPNSEPLSLAERKNDYYEKQRQANLMMEDVVKFIQRNITDYPSWNASQNCNSVTSNGFKTKVIQ
ncbi:hypothetical protein [Flavobacterium sp.]|uniref:DUF6712 family protein n=1 Tax=Flavobacterium sp. TaxID=239 RepID=UPI00286ACF4A|nr:hypothetical protein [Flavobacterium sp.]